MARTFPLPTDYDLDIHDTSSYYGKTSNKFIPIVQMIRHRFMKMRARYYLSLIPKSDERPKILDVGCAEGRLLKSFLEYGCECFGIEHPAYPEHRFLCRDRITYFCENLDSIYMEEKSFDLIFLWHVLEHMDDPSSVMKRLTELLSPEGLLILAVPNFPCPEAHFFKQSWFHLDIPWHKYHFNERSLEYISEKNKLRIVSVNTFCIEQSIYGLLQSILNKTGWPKNELYEAIKGNLTYTRAPQLFVQFVMASSLIAPSLFVSLLMAGSGKGSILNMILKK
ncbi:class I SAM-dependent methyltransferase [Thermodesulfobacteriota bacterium]